MMRDKGIVEFLKSNLNKRIYMHKYNQLFATVKHSLYEFLLRSFRNDCLLCSSNLEFTDGKTKDFCDQCIKQLSKNLLSCELCAIPLCHSKHTQSLVCGACQKHEPPWVKAIAAFIYEYPINKLLIALKYQGRIEFAPALAKLLADDLKHVYDFDGEEKPDCIVPVPLHFIREFQRGYNQAELIAKQLSYNLEIPLNRNLIKRIRHTPSQSSLSKKERQRNLRKAFVCTQSEMPKFIALVDDVMTTGSTVEAITKILFGAGVKRVDVWCCARAEI